MKMQISMMPLACIRSCRLVVTENASTTSDEDGICDEFEIPGCTDVEALQTSLTSALATDDAGNCVYPEASLTPSAMEGSCEMKRI